MKNKDQAEQHRIKPAPRRFERHLRPYIGHNNCREIEKAWQQFISSKPIIHIADFEKCYGRSSIEEYIPCLLCGSETFKHLFTPSKKDWTYKVVMCSECELLYRQPGIKPSKLHVLYDSIDYNSFLAGSYGGAKRQQKYLSVLKSFSDLLSDSEKLKVLDFGCGNGLFLEVAQALGYEGWGVDLSPESIEAAETRLGHKRVWCGDPMDVESIRDQRFDLITLWSVLAHLPEPVSTLQMLRGLLKPGGKLLVMTVNANSLLLKSDRDTWNGFTRNHLAFYSANTARMLFKKAGFSQFFTRPHYANVVGALKQVLTNAEWLSVKQNALESTGGNMNRFIAIN